MRGAHFSRRRFLATRRRGTRQCLQRVGANAAETGKARRILRHHAGLDRGQRPAAAFFSSRDRSQVRFGSLEYRSGLVLTSKFRGFGGLSGLRLDAKGERFIAISDKGGWFTGRIVYAGGR